MESERHRFEKAKRIRKNAEFQRVYRRGKSFVDSRMVLLVTKGPGKTRVGFTAGKKMGNSVQRNHARRLMRESYRLLAPQVSNHFMIVFVARAPMADARFQDVYRSMEKLLLKSGCMVEK